MADLQRQYENPQTLLSSYRREVSQMVTLKARDATALRKLFNFLMKCQTIEAVAHYSSLDTPENSHCIFRWMESQHTAASNKTFKITSVDRPNKLC